MKKFVDAIDFFDDLERKKKAFYRKADLRLKRYIAHKRGEMLMLTDLSTTLLYYKLKSDFYIRDPENDSWIPMPYSILTHTTLSSVRQMLTNNQLAV